MSESVMSKFKSGCLFSGLIFLFTLLGFGLVTALLSGDLELQVNERHQSGAQEGEGVALIEVSGVMARGGDGVGQGSGVTTPLLKMLKRALDDKEVKGVLIRLNTPGGAVTDADLVYHAMSALREAGKKVVLHMDDTCASGGYYASLAADEVWALPTTVTGSIGVIVSTLNVASLMERVGVRDVTLTSGANKALLSPTRPVEEAHVAVLQEVVDVMYERFLSLLIERRGLTEQVARSLADGRVFVAKRALEHKLIDKVGYFEESLTSLKALAKLPANAQVKRYSVPLGFWASLSALTGAGDINAQLSRAALSATQAPQAFYLYAPQGLTAFLLRGLL
jgi:protease-4